MAMTKNPKSFNRLELLKTAHTSDESVPKLEVPIDISGKICVMELDTVTTGNFIKKDYWEKLGCLTLNRPSLRYKSANKHKVPIMTEASTVDRDKTVEVDFHVTRPQLAGTLCCKETEHSQPLGTWTGISWTA